MVSKAHHSFEAHHHLLICHPSINRLQGWGANLTSPGIQLGTCKGCCNFPLTSIYHVTSQGVEAYCTCKPRVDELTSNVCV